jgi:hypothetical protein
VPEHPGQGLGQDVDRTEVDVVPRGLAAGQGVHGVVDVVRPLGGHAVTTGAGRFDHRRVVQVALRDEGQRAAQPRGQPGHLVGQLGQQVALAVVHEGVDGVQA